jgi:hypothetical protein
MTRPALRGRSCLAAGLGEHGIEHAHDAALVGLRECADVLELLLNLRAPGAIITDLAGAVVNGGLGALGGLLKTSQANGAVLGSAGAVVAGGSRSELAGAGYGGALGGAISSQLENSGYPPGVSLPAGGACWSQESSATRCE